MRYRDIAQKAPQLIMSGTCTSSYQRSHSSARVGVGAQHVGEDVTVMIAADGAAFTPYRPWATNTSAPTGVCAVHAPLRP